MKSILTAALAGLFFCSAGASAQCLHSGDGQHAKMKTDQPEQSVVVSEAEQKVDPNLFVKLEQGKKPVTTN